MRGCAGSSSCAPPRTTRGFPPHGVYPTDVVGKTRLGDVTVTIKITSGALSFLGTRTKIAFSDRAAEPLDSVALPAGATRAYRVTSTVLARVFVLGIPVKTARLGSEEWIDPDSGLIRHRLTLKDGSVSVAERISRVGTAPRVTDGSDRAAGR
jgi:hypothetical protein